MINSILNVDRGSFKEFARDMDQEEFKSLSARLSEFKQDMEDTLTKFVDILPIVIAANVFPYLENRTDWNNCTLANKDIHKAVTENDGLAPPWPECQLTNESIEGTSLRSPAFSPDSDIIAHRDDDGNIYLWSRTKGLVANWQGHDRVEDVEDENDDDNSDGEDDQVDVGQDDQTMGYCQSTMCSKFTGTQFCCAFHFVYA
jgi:WD40 repeat protein